MTDFWCLEGWPCNALYVLFLMFCVAMVAAVIVNAMWIGYRMWKGHKGGER